MAARVVPAETQRQKGTSQATAFIGVSVFKEPGFAVAGAEVQLTAAPDQGTSAKTKPLKALTDPRGEFVFRVPPGPMQYSLKVSAKGLKSQHKSVSVQGEERVDATFMLEPESK